MKRTTKKCAAKRKPRRAARKPAMPKCSGTVTGRFTLGMDPPENRAELRRKMTARTDALAAMAERFKSKERNRANRLRELDQDGLEVVYGEPQLLLIDADSLSSRNLAEDLLSKFGEALGVVNVTVRRSRSGNWHLHVRLREALPRLERVLIQGLLGGDPVRAMLDWFWAREGHAADCFLAEVPGNEEMPLDLVLPATEPGSAGYV